MNATALLSKLKGVKKTSNGWEARCPAHDDKKASLSVSESPDGKILLNCKAGCKTESVVAALGLTMKDLFPPRTATHESKPRIVATYDYHNEAGQLLFQCLRYEPKDFRQRRPDPKQPGKWIWDLQGVRRVLYRLPELKAALVAGRTIFIPEGEKDCDELATAGFVATCNPMGAGKWLEEHTETLRGAARVVVIGDKDEAGRKHAQCVARALHSVAEGVKLIELPDWNGKAVKDAAAFFAASGTADELQELVKAAPEFTPTSEPQFCKADSLASEYLSEESDARVSSRPQRISAATRLVKFAEPLEFFTTPKVVVLSAWQYHTTPKFGLWVENISAITWRANFIGAPGLL